LKHKKNCWGTVKPRQRLRAVRSAQSHSSFIVDQNAQTKSNYNYHESKVKLTALFTCAWWWWWCVHLILLFR